MPSGCPGRDLQTHLWAIERDVARADTDAALREYDLALRTSPSARDLLFPVLAAAVAEPTVARTLLRRLAAGPAWRSDFLSYMATEPRVAPAQGARFLVEARAGGAVAAPAEVATLAARALDAGDLDTAWRAYRLVRPDADVRLVRDPTFAALSDTPAVFDWTPSNEGGIVARSVVQDGVSRLEFEAEPGTAGAAIEQLERLSPGRYRLTVDAGPLSDGGEMAWTLSCRGGSELARIALSGGAASRSSRPPSPCPPGAGSSG